MHKKRARATSRVVYVGLDLEEDLRAWLLRVAHDLSTAIAAAPANTSTADSNYFVRVPLNRARDAEQVLRRVAKLKSLGAIFPEQLAHRPKTGRRFWIVVDALDAGPEQYDAVAKRWGTKRRTVVDALRTLGDTVQRSGILPLDQRRRAQLRRLPTVLQARYRARN